MLSQDMLNIDEFQKILDVLTQLRDHMKTKIIIVSQYNKLY